MIRQARTSQTFCLIGAYKGARRCRKTFDSFNFRQTSDAALLSEGPISAELDGAEVWHGICFCEGCDVSNEV